MKITLKNNDVKISEEERNAYANYVKEKYPDDVIDEIILSFGDDGFVDIETHKHANPFVRIRRITGYLTKLDRANNGKREEIKDRVKHEVTE